MKAYIRSANHRIVYEVEGRTTQSLHRAVAMVLHDLVPAEKCRLCGSANVLPVSFGRPSHIFDGLRCQDCKADMGFGHTDLNKDKSEGRLFPSRTEQYTHKPMPHGGWQHYSKAEKEAEEAAAEASADSLGS